MHENSIEDNLQILRHGFRHPNDLTKAKTILTINQFQNDPYLLKSYLSEFVSDVCNVFVPSQDKFNLNLENNIQSQYFYNLCKICSRKIVNKYLTIDVHLLPKILTTLNPTSSQNIPWETWFFLLSWLEITLMSPFEINNRYEIWDITNQFKSNQVLSHIVASIHALLYRNDSMMFYDKLNVYDLNQYDLETINHYLKTQLTESTTTLTSETGKIALNKITQACITLNVDRSETIQISLLKIWPKLFLLQSWNENWDILSDIMNWYDDHMDSDYTEVRFALAHSYNKIMKKMVHDLNGQGEAIRCIEDIMYDLLSLIKSTPMDIIDINTFHCYLLIIAECSKIIIDYLPHFIIVITTEILPIAYHFQQLHMGKVIKGSQIKDAANFIVWSWARYPILPNSVTCDLIKYLVFTTLFDRDVLIRKSSNAALQELLGRHGQSVLDQHTIMELIQLPIHNLHESYSNNLIRLFHICQRESSENGQNIIEHIYLWLFKYNVMKSFDLNIVKLASRAIRDMTTERRISTFESQLHESVSSQDLINSLTCSRLLYFSIDMYGAKYFDPDKSFWKLVNIIEHTKFRSSIRDHEYFQFLTLFKYWNMRLVHDLYLPWTQERMNLFYRIINDISEDNQWFNEFRIFAGNIFHQLELRSLHDAFHSQVTLTLGKTFDSFEDEKFFWDTFIKLLRYNKPLVASSLPRLPGIPSMTFFGYFQANKRFLNCQSKSLILSTLTNDKKSFENFYDIPEHISIFLPFLTDHTITEQGDVGRIVRENACKLIQIHHSAFTPGEKRDTLVPILLNLAAEPQNTVRKLAISILMNQLSQFLPETFLKQNFDIDPQHNIILFNLQMSFQNDAISRTFWRHYFTYAGTLRATEEDLMTGIDDFIQWYRQLSPEESKKTLNNIIISIPSASEIKNDKTLTKYSICGLTFLERLWSSRIACGYVGFNWSGVYAKFHNISLLKTAKNQSLLGAVLKTLPFLAIAWKESDDKTKDLSFINTLIRFLVNLINSNNQPTKSEDEITPIQRRSIESLVGILLEFDTLDKIYYIENFIENHQETPILEISKLNLQVRAK